MSEYQRLKAQVREIRIAQAPRKIREAVDLIANERIRLVAEIHILGELLAEAITAGDLADLTALHADYRDPKQQAKCATCRVLAGPIGSKFLSGIHEDERKKA